MHEGGGQSTQKEHADSTQKGTGLDLDQRPSRNNIIIINKFNLNSNTFTQTVILICLSCSFDIKKDDITMHHQQDVLIHHFIAQFIPESKPQNNILSEFEFITLMMKPNVLKLGHKCLYGVDGCRRPVAALITYSGHSIKTLLLPFKYVASCD